MSREAMQMALEAMELYQSKRGRGNKGDDPKAATRRAIVRAAAEIGKLKEKNHG